MDYRLLRFLIISLISLLLFSAGCQKQTDQDSGTQDKPAGRIYKSQENKQIKERSNNPFFKYHAKSRKRSKRSTENYTNNRTQQNSIPKKVYDVLKYVLKNKQAPADYVGGRRFGNFEAHLPRHDLEGRKIEYQEWDVNPKKRGRNRGVERLVTGSDGRAWYTNDHYNSFTEIK